MDTMMGAIIVEYHMAGDLSQLITESQKEIGTEAVKNIFKDLAAALAYCHYGIRAPDSPLPNWDAVIHKDIRLENIFLSPDNNAPGGLISILGDFGSSTNEAAELQLRRQPRGANRPGGDQDWLPPEAPRLTAKSDVWGLATVMACVCQRVAQPRELRKTLGNYHVGGDDGRSHCEIHARYGRRFGEIVREMEREDVGRRWDSRKVFQEVDVGVVYTPWQGGDEEFVPLPR
ncbi:G2-specific protein kinase fin1 [Lasiodiplodia theobromae]|uniref:EKC/KEOPS complex subunit BUD32 n=1 Tax=Lasiodiplodia theobromae TaxID=45133 RepID=A0A5N5D4K5_9PEZI|nr:G2-specific protein kinase fin1 [Lasiodiplodia theobromae]